ncbi:hypothetical protein Oweho_2837 [Owenweeksia hongkongensis DSM 17368]|uniref:Outer membrane protein beta-barrel domain-containing protein n=1 Tax=Owenweeksia hongkongensis (strain DSM 17368 / CIP 108786 / JCM 12287 / NRRL B-23963 / UST20020801) TaxID=926562 RepID=G8R0S0_OWEHD|nr:porin family protein [Owenweeksia hongkongensis]AEV33797.1 hypothetical protein Oweho_2837 [Owenweeksia hongkongensis DSM 17368]
MKNLNAKVIILLVITSFGLKAQETTPVAATTPLRFGLHASPNISYIQSNDPDAESSSKVKFAFGLMVEYNFAPNYSFSTGVDYIFRGGELTLPVEVSENPSVFINRTGTYQAGMVQIPLYLKMRTKEFGYMRYFAEFGGRLGFPVDQLTEFEDSSPGFEVQGDALEKNYINPIDVMFSIGLGGEYNLGGNTSLVAGLYYNRSLADNVKTSGGTLGTEKKYGYRFDYINLKVGILF